ncbi:hypothetical protein ACOME3_004992 [Neoechinorhynchus agilis]
MRVKEGFYYSESHILSKNNTLPTSEMLRYHCDSLIPSMKKYRDEVNSALNHIPKKVARKCVMDIIEFVKTATLPSHSILPQTKCESSSKAPIHRVNKFENHSIVNIEQTTICWFIQCLRFGVQFTLGDFDDDIATDEDVDRELERMKCAVEVCCEWLSVLRL